MPCRLPECRHGVDCSIGIERKTPGPMLGPTPFFARDCGAACPARPRDRLRSCAGIPGHSWQSHRLDRARPLWRSLSRRRSMVIAIVRSHSPGEEGGSPVLGIDRACPRGSRIGEKTSRSIRTAKSQRSGIVRAVACRIVDNQPGGRRACPGVMLKVPTRRPKNALPPPGCLAASSYGSEIGDVAVFFARLISSS